jgi:hypothetical protein
MVVGGGPTISIHHYELKAAYANINHFHPSLRVPLFDFDGPRIFQLCDFVITF